MADISKITANGTTYDVKDATARAGLANKVNTADIVDSLSSEDANKPLSAKQGRVLNDRIYTIETVIELTDASTVDEFNDAVNAYLANSTRIVYNYGTEYCVLSSVENEPEGFFAYFISAASNKRIQVYVNGSELATQTFDLDTHISVTYANEELTIW